MFRGVAFRWWVVVWVLMTLGTAGSGALAHPHDDEPETGPPAPRFQVDPYWPKLPGNWILGQVAGIAVDRMDHIWIVQRPGSLDESERGAVLNPPRSLCCTPAPPVMEFDADGHYIQGWGGPEYAPEIDGVNQWPTNEHGIYVDAKRNVWIAGNGADNHVVLKFTADGEFLMQIGRRGVTGGDHDTEHLGHPADIWVDTEKNEVYISDGYTNHRVIVYDSETGEFKRYWGADALPPGDPTVRQFGNPVHCVVGGPDGLIYVCDRVNNRIQVFRNEPDGRVSFVREFYIADKTLGNGAVWDLDFSPDGTYMYVADGENQRVWIVRRTTGKIESWFGRGGHYAGQFTWVHNIAVDSRGNIYTAEVHHGKRAQKFVYVGWR